MRLLALLVVLMLADHVRPDGLVIAGKGFPTANSLLTRAGADMNSRGSDVVLLLNAAHDEDCVEPDRRSQHYSFLKEITSKAVAAHPNVSVVVLMGASEFWDCPLEPRIIAVQDGGGTGALFTMSPEYSIPHHSYSIPTDGSLGDEDFLDKVIPSCFTVRDVLDHAQWPAPGGNASSLVSLEGIVCDEDPQQALQFGAGGVAFFVILAAVTVADLFVMSKCVAELRSLLRRRRKKGAKQKKSARFGVKDMVLLVVMLNAFLTMLDIAGYCWTYYGGYPVGHGADAARYFQGIGVFFAMGPTANLALLLVIFAWADAITFTGRTNASKLGIFKDSRLQLIFVVANGSTWLLEIVHVTMYIHRDQADRIVGFSANVLNTLATLSMAIGVLHFGKKTISALTSNPSARRKTSGQDGSTQLPPAILKMYRFITYVSWLLMLAFAMGVAVVVFSIDKVPALFVFLFYAPMKVVQAAACYMLVSVVTSSEKKKGKKGKKSVAPATDVGSSVAAGSTIESSAAGSAASTTERSTADSTSLPQSRANSAGGASSFVDSSAQASSANCPASSNTESASNVALA